MKNCILRMQRALSRGSIIARGLFVLVGIALVCGAGLAQTNLATSATPSAWPVAATSQAVNATDGNLATACVSNWNRDDWFQLQWSTPVAFTQVKVSIVGANPLYPGQQTMGWHTFNIQRWDDSLGRWFDVANVGNSAGVFDQVNNVTVFNITVPGGLPITTSKIRMNTSNYVTPALQVAEFEVYNSAVTTACISGRVTDATTGVGLEGVWVTTTDGMFRTESGKDGVYHLDVTFGYWEVQMARAFYNTVLHGGFFVMDGDKVEDQDVALVREQSANIAPFANPYADKKAGLFYEHAAIDANRDDWPVGWSSNYQDYGSGKFYLDWGELVDIDSITLSFLYSSPEYSLDYWDVASGSWVNMSSGAAIPSNPFNYIPASTIRTTKLRLSYTNIDTASFGIAEFEVYGLPVLGGYIAGKVTDATTGKPVWGATVTAAPGGASDSTDKEGNYRLSVLSGTYSVTASRGTVYLPSTQNNVTVSNEQTTALNFPLTPDSSQSDNLALAAVPSAMITSGVIPNVNDGDKSTSYDSTWNHGWFTLEWPNAVTFTQQKIYFKGENPLSTSYGSSPLEWHTLNVQRWDGTKGRWFDVINVGNAAGVYDYGTATTCFDLVVPGGVPITTDKLRLNFACYDNPQAPKICEWEVYNNAITTASISGRVTDAVSGIGLEGVQIVTWDGMHSTESGEDGVYHLSVPAGTYDLDAMRELYNVGTIYGIPVGANQAVANRDFALTRQSATNLAPYANAYADGKISVLWEALAIDDNVTAFPPGTSNWGGRGDGAYYLDWGSDINIERVAFNHIYDAMSSYSLEVWDDSAEEWTSIASGVNVGSFDYTLSEVVRTTKLRLKYTAPDAVLSAIGLTEMQVFGVEGQAGVITGKVTDGASGANIAGAQVTVTSAGKTVYTDINGDYEVLVPAGTHSMTVSRGLMTNTANASGISVADGQTVTRNFALTLNPAFAGNLSVSALASAWPVDGSSSAANGIDGDLASGCTSAWNRDEWFQLEWPTTVTFTQVKAYMLGQNPLYSDGPGTVFDQRGLCLQRWDSALGRWFDILNVSNAAGVYDSGTNTTCFDLTMPGGVPITTSKLRMYTNNYVHGPNQVAEFAVYNTPITTARISGRVTDGTSGIGLEGVRISTDAGQRGITTQNGEYNLTVPAGTYQVQALCAAYDAAAISGVVVGTNQQVTGKNFTLTRKPSTNMALFANAYADTKANGIFYARAAIDGNGDNWPWGFSEWQCYGNSNFYLDWGTPVVIGKIDLDFNYTYPGFSFDYWNAATGTWVPIVSGPSIPGWPYSYTLSVPVVTTKLRFACVGADQYTSFGIKEIAVYAPVTPPVDLAQDGKATADGVYVGATGYVVTAVFADGIYIQNTDRTLGIKVIGVSGSPVVGNTATITGTMGTSNGERVIQATTSNFAAGVPTGPLGMTNATLGGSDEGINLGVTGGVGVNNLGLLVRTTGKVTAVNGASVIIDDGSNVGVEVLNIPGSYDVGDLVRVTGIASVKVDGPNRTRVIRPRDISDIVED